MRGLVEIARALHRCSWMVEVAKQRPVGILHPYTVEVYVAVDGSEACISLNPAEGFMCPKRSREGDRAGAGI